MMACFDDLCAAAGTSSSLAPGEAESVHSWPLQHRAVPLLALAVLASCAPADGDSVLDITYDPCEPTVLAAAGDTSPRHLAALERAIELWNAVLDTRLSIEPEPGATALPVRFEDAAPFFHGVYEDEIGEVIINSRLEGDALDVTVAHELGHAFGLWHVSARSSVMQPGNLEVAPSAEDAEAVASHWPSCAAPAR